ncbi:TetR/AcrR family transcriptional regulator [Lentzea aerocolonigenes]|uniref:TetR/AcrR family transcriptional regulator n=1 Tax=Lentzea aerocolonigenes TaxID=68170 RepID=UPI0004C2DACC|nr:TetR/AcrR family transcriptional regulator [Lentzea aerocolonigenes]MCP2251114.1 transcriptional regulator, TetR family [Lentzea aerocolonigenes]
MTTTENGKARRRGRPGYDLETLLKAAAELFYERGYDGTSIQDLATRLGVAKSAIYHHVPSKEALLSLAVDRALDGLFAEVTKLEPVGGRAIDRLEHLVRGSITVLIDELPFVTLLLRVRGNTETERNALARRREFDHVVTDLVAQAAAEGDLRADVHPAMITRLLFGMVNSIIEWYRPQGGLTSADLAETVATVAFDGLRVRST